jgi:hypothetical protein
VTGHTARSIAVGALGAAIIGLFAADASALRYQARPGWMFGVGFGYGKGRFTDPLGENTEYRMGATPMIRFGRMLGGHAMINFNYDAWLIEYDAEPGTISDERLKIRRSLQNGALTITVFPGNPDGPSGGFYLRAGAGVGWTGTAQVDITTEEAQHHGDRIDEWGVGIVGEMGYELWVSDVFTVGMVGAYNYFDIGELIVDTAWFASAAFTLNAYFH